MAAADIVREFLDDTGDAVMRDRFERYAERIDLPFNLVTRESNLVISTHEDLQEGFDYFVDMIAVKNVTHLNRTVLRAVFGGQEIIFGIYQTRLLSNGAEVIPSFRSTMCLQRKKGTWKTTRIRNTTRDTRWPIFLPKVDRESPKIRKA